MPQSFSSPRLLLNRLRQVMASHDGGQERLSSIVKLIAATMIADVCSIYLRTKEDQLELVATEGLRSEAVALTRLSMDEGLVGLISQTAEPLAIEDAPRHPNFAYRPETGEDPYHAFLGVPILRGGRVIGVLTVQNRTERSYDEDEIETLQTIAMVIAEVIASETGPGGEYLNARSKQFEHSETLKGRSISPGLGIGQACYHDPVVPTAKFFALDTEAELRRLAEALHKLRASIDRMMDLGSHDLGEDPLDIMEAYRMLANDPGWASRLAEGIKNGLSAEASVDRARREHRAKLESARDPYLKARLNDLEDIDNRLLRILGGHDGADHVAIDEGSVLVARRLGPAELLEYSNAGLSALVLEEPAAASHAAIVARALGIPTIGGVTSVTTLLEAGDTLIVDAELGQLHIRPDEDVIAAYRARQELLSERQKVYRQLRDEKAMTRDGVEIRLMLNAGLKLDVEHLTETGAEGIGLFRTEFQFLISKQLPSLKEQKDFYAYVMDAAHGRPVYFRTLDVGADKIMASFAHPVEENPALGWRAIRFALDREGLFRRQLRALIRAAAGRPLYVMFPMVTVASEFLAAKALFLKELSWARRHGHPVPLHYSVGAMLETPALAFELEALSGQADFICVGTNDLMQFFHAADRMVPSITERYEFIARGPMAFLSHIVQLCDKLNMAVSVCGEAAGKPLDALALICLGYRSLSMPAASIGPVKRMIRSIDLAVLSNKVYTLLGQSTGSFREDFLALCKQHNVLLEIS